MSSVLGIWMNGELVGHWSVQRGTGTLTYASSWLQSDKVRSLSLSLPITGSREIRGPVVANWFDNLLPDNDSIRKRLSRRFRTRTPRRSRCSRRSAATASARSSYFPRTWRPKAGIASTASR